MEFLEGTMGGRLRLAKVTSIPDLTNESPSCGSTSSDSDSGKCTTKPKDEL